LGPHFLIEIRIKLLSTGVTLCDVTFFFNIEWRERGKFAPWESKQPPLVPSSARDFICASLIGINIPHSLMSFIYPTKAEIYSKEH
jgi:hypothetical protein